MAHDEEDGAFWHSQKRDGDGASPLGGEDANHLGGDPSMRGVRVPR